MTRSVRHRRGGFALVLAFSVLAMLVLLAVGGAALLALELRIARSSGAVAKARLNALAGARIALGELQRTLGPDQRATAEAGIFGDPANDDPFDRAAYAAPGGRRVTHPHWVGVWNSGNSLRTASGEREGVEALKVVGRTPGGYLTDARFAGGRDWERDRLTGKDGRLVTWLVSGNEALPEGDARVRTPFDVVGADDVSLAGSGSVGAVSPNPDNAREGDYRGARAAKVPFTDDSGSYAYWIADEGVKARVNLADKFELRIPKADKLAGGGFDRLAISQRAGFDAVVAPGAAKTDPAGGASFAGYAAFASARHDEAHWSQSGWARVASFDDIALLLRSFDAEAARRTYFHDIGFVSAGVFSDAVNGGLRKDLTAFLNACEAAGAPTDIPDIAGVPGSGIAYRAPIVDAPGLSAVSPAFGVLDDWTRVAGMNGHKAGDGGNTKYNVPDVLPKTYALKHTRTTDAAEAALGLPSYAGASAKAVQAPVLAGFDYHFAVALPKKNEKARDILFLLYPKITVWNPYPVTLKPEGQLQVTLLTCVQPRCNVGAAIYNSRPVRRYNLGRFELAPGACVTFVPVPGQDFSNIGKAVHGAVDMEPGAPSESAYYLDRGMKLDNATKLTTAAGDDLSDDAYADYFSSFLIEATGSSANVRSYDTPSASYDEGTLAGPFMQLFLVRRNGGADTVLRQVDVDPWCALLSNDAYGAVNVAEGTSYKVRVGDIDSVEKASRRVRPGMHHGFRLLRVDDEAPTGDPGGLRNTDINTPAGFNLLASRVTRTPFDASHLVRVNNTYGFAPFTTVRDLDFTDYDEWFADAKECTPLLSPRNAPYGLRFAMTDVHRNAIGLLSIGRLRHAPLLSFPAAPGAVFGNAFLPSFTRSADLSWRSGYTEDEENGLWAKVNATTQFGAYIRQRSGGTAAWGTRALDGSRMLADWSYELNRALWDGAFLSTIPATNAGWTGAAWDFSLTGTGATVADSRLAAVADLANIPALRPADALYRASRSLLHNGAFNVNSVSVVAWQAMLFSFRGLVQPTVEGRVNTDDETPYAGLTVPVHGPLRSTTPVPAFAKETWGGFRALSDDEVRTLAAKIVAEVKTRGPFLGLSDFVNRRLRPVSADDRAKWTERERAHLGALQAAIEAAGINARLDASTGPLRLDRTREDVADTRRPGSSFAPADPVSKPVSKLVGTPGYFTQADLLEKLGPVLASRSDTFTVRARGESPEGAVAFVEIVVQRIPQPLFPDRTRTFEPVSTPRDSAVPGNQKFGRRMRVVSTRWISAEAV